VTGNLHAEIERDYFYRRKNRGQHTKDCNRKDLQQSRQTDRQAYSSFPDGRKKKIAP
jgi:hypothetical protein